MMTMRCGIGAPLALPLLILPNQHVNNKDTENTQKLSIDQINKWSLEGLYSYGGWEQRTTELGGIQSGWEHEYLSAE